MEIKIKDVKNYIKKSLPMKVKSTEDNDLLLTLEREDFEGKWTLENDKIDSIISKIQSKENEDETMLYDDNNYEVLIQLADSNDPRFSREFRKLTDKNFEKEDETNDICYSLSTPSEEYLFFLLHWLSRKP